MNCEKGNLTLGISAKWHKCSSINQSQIVEPSFTSQSGDFNQLPQDNSEDIPFNSPSSWSIPFNKGLQTKEEHNKRKEAIANWPLNNTSTNKKTPKRVTLILSHKVTGK